MVTQEPGRERYVERSAGVEVGENVMPVRNRVQWGPILAGVVTTITTMLLLTVLGLAIGASALEPRDSGDTIGTAAAIWGGISAIIAFFVGGWVAAKTAAVGGPGSGLINGLMVGAAMIALVLWLTGSGVGAILGTIGTNLGDIANIAQDTAQQEGVTPEEAQTEAEQTGGEVAEAITNPSQEAFDTARDSAFGTFIGLVLALGAAALGGFVGHNKRRDLIEGTR